MAHFNRRARAENLLALSDPERPIDAVVTLKPSFEDSRRAIARLGPVPVTYLLPYGTSSGDNRRSRGNDYIVKVYVARWPADDAEAAVVRKQASAGDPVAQMSLGVMHEYGRGVPLDAANAAAWYRKAAD